MAQTPMIDQSIWLPKLFQGMGPHAGFIIAIVAAILIYWFTHKTVTGYEIRMLSDNPSFATYGGVRRIRMMMLSMVISGGLAGLAGAGEVLGTQYRFLDGSLSSASYAWSGIMATLLARSHPLGTAVAAILLGATDGCHGDGTEHGCTAGSWQCHPSCIDVICISSDRLFIPEAEKGEKVQCNNCLMRPCLAQPCGL